MFKLLSPRKSIKLYLANQVLFLSTQGNVDNVLTTHLNINSNVVKGIKQFKKNDISKIPEKKLIQNCTIMKELNVNLKEIEYLEYCLKLHPMVIRNRILILKEMGVKTPSLNHIYRYPSSMRRSIKQFKKIHGIPPKENIIQNIMNNIGLTIDQTNVNIFNENMRTSEFYKLFMMYYKTFYLQLHNEIFYKNTRHKYHSFQQLKELLNIFETKYHFDTKFLSKHAYLLRQDKSNIESFLTEFKDRALIDNRNIIQVAVRFPRILCYPREKVKKLLVLCKRLDIPVRSIIMYICTLKLKEEVFISRYINILNSYELSVWSKHPRVLHLIYLYNLVQTRVEYLRLCNRMTTANIHTYLGSEQFFIKYVRGDLCHTANRKHLLYILSKELGDDKIFLIDHIAKHPRWKSVSLLLIAKTIEYLKKYYSIEDICRNIHIVLYPESAISEATNIINKEFLPDKGYHFTSSQYLALCMYIIEKKYHFDGNAVWQRADTKTLLTNPDLFENTEEVEYENFIKNLATNDTAIHDLNGIAWLQYLLR